MIGRAPLFALAAVAIVAAIGSLLAEGNLAIAVPFAIAATGAAAAVAGLVLIDRLEVRPKETAAFEPPPTVAVLDGLVGGAFARQTVINDLRVLERKFAIAVPPIDPAEEAKVLEMPRKEFLKWVTERVTLLEART